MAQKSKTRYSRVVSLVSFLVGLYGVVIIGSTLVDQFAIHHLRILSNFTDFTIDLHLLFGLGFVYLSLLLARRKRNALIVALGAFFILLAYGVVDLFIHHHSARFTLLDIGRDILLPLMIMAALVLAHGEFQVKSDQETFRSSLKLAVLVLVITLAYGVGGFMLMDNSDFHQEIGFGSALHHTIDQFDLTTNHPLHPYTKRAVIFMDSLSFVSVAAVCFLLISLFQPVKARFGLQNEQRDRIKQLMDSYGAPSEDFFKLWPRDKHYHFASGGEAALAFQPRRSVALVLGDPIGDKKHYFKLLSEFGEMCWANDWQPALVHVDGRYAKLYRDCGFQLQLIGQEAFVDIEKFAAETANNKYFRNIKNRFNKENFSFEIIHPPHHTAVVERLKDISDEWLQKPGRTERGFVMGYFSPDYVQQCSIAIVRDAAQTILAFMNLVPSKSFNNDEATYDMLRSVKDSPPNVNDYMLCQLIHALKEEGYKSLNLGLSPLVGLDEDNSENSLISSVMRFAYANGERIYSFSGLHRFKDKYEPRWEDRYLGYKGGVPGFSKMLNALVLAMKVRHLKR